MDIFRFSEQNLHLQDLEHFFIHKKSQIIKHSAANGLYISSACTGFRWKGDYIKQYFETIVYKYHTEPISLKRIITGPLITYTYGTYAECIDHHIGLLEDIWYGVFNFDSLCINKKG
jgi:hypothetical protein